MKVPNFHSIIWWYSLKMNQIELIFIQKLNKSAAKKGRRIRERSAKKRSLHQGTFNEKKLADSR